MDNKKLARFITALGQFDSYGSTVAQTELAIATGCTSHLRQDNDDVVIFQDCLKAINKVQDMTFGVKSIIAINTEFNGDASTQPKYPGRLRDMVAHGPEDRIRVPLWADENRETVFHYPPHQVDELDVQRIVDEWEISEKTKIDAWKMFGRLACLQPFQDGNKRTALISINHAMGKLNDQHYLLPPPGLDFNDFMSNLLKYYYWSKSDKSEQMREMFAKHAVEHEVVPAK